MILKLPNVCQRRRHLALILEPIVVIVASRLVHLSWRNLRLDNVNLLILQLLDYLVTGLSVTRPNKTEKFDLARPNFFLLFDRSGNLAMI